MYMWSLTFDNCFKKHILYHEQVVCIWIIYINSLLIKYNLLQIITLSASANKLSNIQMQADEYARLIMEELDPNELGYIMVN